MRQTPKILPFFTFLLLTIVTCAKGDQCTNYNETECNTTGIEICKWENNQCTEISLRVDFY